MQQDVITLYSKASQSLLEAEEAGFLETLISRDPWFALPHIILARHHYQSQSTVKDRILLRAAAYANDRSHLRNYIVGQLSMPVTWEEKETPVSEPLTEAEAAEAPVAKTPVLENPVAEPLERDAETETPVVETEVPQVEESPVETVEKNSEEPVAEKESPAPVSMPSPVANPGINWGLNMRVKLRQEKYAALGKRIEEQLAEYKAAQPLSEPVAKTKTPVTEVPEVKAPETPQEETPVAETEVSAPLVEEQPAEKPAKKKKPAAKQQPEKQTKAEKPVKEKKPKKRPPIGKKSEVDVPEEPQREYAIGEFSGLSFLESADNEDGDKGAQEPVMEAETESPVEPEKDAGIVLGESDRVIEIRISPEQRAKYFKGQAPMELEFSGFNPDDLGIYVPEKELAEMEPLPEKKTSEKDALIDKFIQEDPSITHPNEYQGEDENKSRDSDRGYEDLVTETLAQIHAKQGNTKQAIGIYEKLSLLFPDKRSYFASQIEKLRQ